MKVLILTQYFPPEVGAPQNRLYGLASRIRQKGAEVTVITAMPNYPQMEIHAAYKGRLHVKEEMNGLTIHRSWIFVSKQKGVSMRLMNYFSFVFSSFWTGFFRLKEIDCIICESPPLFLGMTAYLLKKLKGAKLVFNVADLWPESAEKMGIIKNRFLLNRATNMEEFLYRKSDLISGQSQGICKNISERFPNKKVHWYPNSADLRIPEKTKNDFRAQNGFREDDFLLLYAGIIGHAQGLEVILKAAQQLRSYPAIKFILLGSGPEKEKLVALKRELETENVIFLDAVPKKEMASIMASIDVTVIPLRRLDLFRGVIPSKIFESLTYRKAILLGVEGESKELFIDEGRSGLAFVPEDAADLKNKVLELYGNPSHVRQLGENGFEYVRTKFESDQVSSLFYEELLKLQNTTKAKEK